METSARWQCSNTMQPHTAKYIQVQNGQTASNCRTIEETKSDYRTNAISNLTNTVFYSLLQLNSGLASYARPHGFTAQSAQSLLEVQSKPWNWCSRQKRTRSRTQPVAFPRVRLPSITTCTALWVRHTGCPPSRQRTARSPLVPFIRLLYSGLFVMNRYWRGGSNKVASECRL